MTKTNFDHGTDITPEFLNAINSPTFVEVPTEDGQFSIPPQIGAERLRALAAEGALQEGIDSATELIQGLIDSKTFDSAPRTFGDLQAYLALTPVASPAGVTVSMDDNYSNSPAPVTLSDTDSVVHALASGIAVASLKGRGGTLGVDGSNGAFGGAPNSVTAPDGGIGTMVTPGPHSLAVRIPSGLRKLTVASIAPAVALPVFQLLLIADQDPSGTDPYSYGFRLSIHLQHNTTIYMGVSNDFPDTGYWYRAHGDLTNGSPRVLWRPGSATAYHTRAEYFVRIARGEPIMIEDTLIPGPRTYSISRLLTGEIAATNVGEMLLVP